MIVGPYAYSWLIVLIGYDLEQPDLRFDEMERAVPAVQDAFKPLVSIVTVVFNRAEGLNATIDSVQAQSYGRIEHVVVDGGSTDETVDVIAKRRTEIDRLIQEPDDGIYDAINKGVRASAGDFVLILHAADLLEAGFIDRAVSAALETPEAINSTIIYSGYRHGSREVLQEEMSVGIFLHYLNINHSTFLVPAAVYQAIGPYEPNLKIVSDALWVRKAFANGVTFRAIPGAPLFFAEGGASEAQDARARQRIISEWSASYRVRYPFLTPEICTAIYLYRFEEVSAGRIVDYLAETQDMADPPALFAEFRAALTIMCRFLWRKRPLDVDATGKGLNLAMSRIRLAERLGVDVEEANIASSGVALATLFAEIAEMRAKIGGRKVTLHYLEVFSRPTETFIPDLINDMAEGDDAAHVILCDHRVMAEERPYALLIAFEHPAHCRHLADWITNQILERLGVDEFIFHFAINGMRLLTRVDRAFRDLPAIYMTHGIDVADLDGESDYRTFIVDGVAHAPKTRFTAVSAFLADQLAGFGVPPEKISIVHNSIDDRFWRNRTPAAAKAAARRESGYDVRLLNIGRIVAFKGHEYLVEAVALLRDQHQINAHLTIVWGGHGPGYQDLVAQITALSLEDRIALVEHVNFDETPRYFDDFDIFALSSYQTPGPKSRAEAFGIATLEAIAAGLPVVTTDSGGQPEVAGENGPMAQIVPEKSAAALAEGVAVLIKNGALEGDNGDYARARLELFSRANRRVALTRARQFSPVKRLKAALFSTTVNRGAGGAAYKVHRSLIRGGVDSQLYCRHRTHDFEARVAVTALKAPVGVDAPPYQPGPSRLMPGYTIFSIDTPGLGADALQEVVADADVINVHWYARFLSNADIAMLSNLGKPLVLTIRDMHPLTGGCHFFHGCDQWKGACDLCPQLRDDQSSLARNTLAMKRRDWNIDNITVVALSEHSRRIIAQSALFEGARIEVIPNPGDWDVFYPRDRAAARQRFGLRDETKVIAYLPSSDSKIKGLEHAERALALLRRKAPDLDATLLLAGSAPDALETPFPSVKTDYLDGREDLAAFYSAADVTLIPSLEETFSNTCQESVLCGTPVVGFRTGAIPDMAAEGRGEVAEPGDDIGLAEGLARALARPEKPVEACRDFALAAYSDARTGELYKALFEELAARPPIAPKPLGASDLHLRGLVSSTARALAGVPQRQAGLVGAIKGAAVDLLPVVQRGDGVRITKAGLRVSAGAGRHATYGPYLRLDAGRYRAEMAFGAISQSILSSFRGAAQTGLLEIAVNVDEILAQQPFLITRANRRHDVLEVDFELTAEQAREPRAGVEFRVWAESGADFEIRALRLHA